MAEQILADNPRTTTREGILQRTTRGMLTFNTGKVHKLEGELWAVPSTRGGFHQVDLSREECDCEDFTFYGSAAGVACRHVYAAAIATATDARRRREVRRCEVCGVRATERTLIGLKNDRRRYGPRWCLSHHPASMARANIEEGVQMA